MSSCLQSVMADTVAMGLIASAASQAHSQAIGPPMRLVRCVALAPTPTSRCHPRVPCALPTARPRATERLAVSVSAAGLRLLDGAWRCSANSCMARGSTCQRWTSRSVRHRSPASALARSVCQDGFGGAGGSCVQCSAGFYGSGLIPSQTCLTCTNNHVAPTAGASSCVACPGNATASQSRDNCGVCVGLNGPCMSAGDASLT